MSAADPRDKEPIGLGILYFFVRHATAANLLMATLIIVGLFCLFRLNKQFFPTLHIPIITVNITWPGASAADVDANIVEVVEPAVRSVNGVTRVSSIAQEGFGVTVLSFSNFTNMQEALAEVESQVNALDTLPEDSEDPVIRRVAWFAPVSSIALSGPFSEGALKVFAKRIRDDLLDAGIDQITISGVRDEEIWVEMYPEALLRHALTIDQVSGRIRAAHQNQPLGLLKAENETQLRVEGLPDEDKRPGRLEQAVGQIEVRSLPDGGKLRVRDVATVRETFAEGVPSGLRNGQNAARVTIQAAETTDVIDASNIIYDYLERVVPTFPQSLNVEIFDDGADLVRSRISLMVSNSLMGLVLVLVVLFLLLKPRVAIWVAIGIPTCICALFIPMYFLSQTINMISMFGMLMMIGVIVDDAIVVAEHTVSQSERGASAEVAALRGARRMFGPVLASTLTTIAAFLPIMLVRDLMGQMMMVLAIVVVIVIAVSFVECFLVLPGHLRHALSGGRRMKMSEAGAFARRFDSFKEKHFRRMVAWCYDFRYLTLAIAWACLIVAFGPVVSGRLGVDFFPSPEASSVVARISFVPGTPRDKTREAVGGVEEALHRAARGLTQGKERVVKMTYGVVGTGGAEERGETAFGSHLGELIAELVPSADRTVRTADLVAAWREELPTYPGLERIVLELQQGGPAGKAVDVLLTGAPLSQLKAAANDLRAYLAGQPGVFSIQDSAPYGKREVVLEVTPKGRAKGFTTQSIARQIRGDFTGDIARRFARGDEEIVVRVRLAQAQDIRSLSDVYVTAPDGSQALLSEVTTMEERVGFSRIQRRNNRPFVRVTAEIDRSTTSSFIVLSRFSSEFVPHLKETYGADFVLAGEAEDQAKTFADLRFGLLLALSMIYIVLAWTFGNYSQPFVAMSIVPFSLVGVIVGNLIMGFQLTVMSFIAMLGLSGILVNGSIVLVSEIASLRREGLGVRDSVIQGSCNRLRAIVLSSFTTVLGLTPLLFETDIQAKFLQPMVITLIGGLSMSVFLVLLLVPALLRIQEDVSAAARRLLARAFPRDQASSA